MPVIQACSLAVKEHAFAGKGAYREQGDREGRDVEGSVIIALDVLTL